MTGMLIRAPMFMKYWLSLPQNVASERKVLLKGELLVFVQTCALCVMVPVMTSSAMLCYTITARATPVKSQIYLQAFGVRVQTPRAGVMDH